MSEDKNEAVELLKIVRTEMTKIKDEIIELRKQTELKNTLQLESYRRANVRTSDDSPTN